LAFKCPEEILRTCGPTIPSELQSKLGEWSNQGPSLRGKRLDGLAYAVTERVPADLLVEVSITQKPNTRSAGVLFRTTPDLARGYMVRLELPLCRVVFERWPKPWPWKKEFWRNVASVRGTHPFMVERALNPNQFSWEKPITIQLLIHGTVAEVFVNDRVALVTRIYDHKDGNVGLFVEHGEARFNDISFKSIP
jgi:beta-fructofuranosidase